MKIHNTRSPEQWKIISRHVNFKGKSVLDFGCGKGDILIRAFEAGAIVIGLDEDKANVEYIRGIQPQISVIRANLDSLRSAYPVNIAICFSVLPYLEKPKEFTRWINRISDIALIECQYVGDGPGFHFLKGNDEMEAWLLEEGQFQKVKVIGHTLVEGRNKKRFIWMCE